MRAHSGRKNQAVTGKLGKPLQKSKLDEGVSDTACAFVNTCAGVRHGNGEVNTAPKLNVASINSVKLLDACDNSSV